MKVEQLQNLSSVDRDYRFITSSSCLTTEITTSRTLGEYFLGVAFDPPSTDGFCAPTSFDYEPAEVFDENEPEDFIPDETEQAEAYEGGAEESYDRGVNGNKIVVSGDPSAGYGGPVMEQHRAKKIPNDQRTTTPYMTKYERARVLGTRALQIRCVDAWYSMWW